jgi:hypothetical protein
MSIGEYSAVVTITTSKTREMRRLLHGLSIRVLGVNMPLVGSHGMASKHSRST